MQFGTVKHARGKKVQAYLPRTTDQAEAEASISTPCGVIVVGTRCHATRREGIHCVLNALRRHRGRHFATPSAGIRQTGARRLAASSWSAHPANPSYARGYGECSTPCGVIVVGTRGRVESV